MDEFLKIDWTPDITDVLDKEFIPEERILKESVMYRIMSGTFREPFGILRHEEMTKKPEYKLGPRKQQKKHRGGKS